MALLGEDDDFFGDDDEDDIVKTDSNVEGYHDGKKDTDVEGGNNYNHDTTTTTTTTTTTHGSSTTVVDGLASAEMLAMEDRYRKLGFHEGYEKGETEMLQDGFTHGFAETFEIAKHIGSRIGELTFLHYHDHNTTTTIHDWIADDDDESDKVSSPSFSPSSSIPTYLEAAKVTRDFLTQSLSNNQTQDHQDAALSSSWTTSSKDRAAALKSTVEHIYASSTRTTTSTNPTSSSDVGNDNCDTTR